MAMTTRIDHGLASRVRGSARRAQAWRVTPKSAVLVAVAVIVGYLALTPLLFLIWRMFTDSEGAFTFQNIVSAVNDPFAGQFLWDSFVYAIGTTVLAMVLGTTLAYFHALTDISFKPALFAASIVPLVIPGLLYTVAWILLASPRTGLINMSFDNLFGSRPLDIFSMWGMIWVEGATLAPIAFLLMLAGFKSLDPSMDEAARVAGASNWTVARRITFPLAKPAFLASGLLLIVRAIESFETPVLLGMPAGIWVFTSRIWSKMTQYPYDLGAASVDAVVLLLIAIVGVVLHNWYARRGGEKSLQTIGGKGFSIRPRKLVGRSRIAANTLVLAFVFTVIVVPCLTLLYCSLLPVNMTPSKEAFESMNLENYRGVIDSPLVRTGAINSAFLAIATATAVMFLMAIAAWIVVRTKVRGRGLLDNLSFMPMTFPGLVLGLALLVLYLRVPVPIYGTYLILFIAYFTKYMPYGMRYAATSMYQIHSDLEESAQVAGASWWQSFRRIILPLIMPGLVAGWIYIALVSVRELSTSLLIYTPGKEVLAISMWNLYKDGKMNELAALGVLLIVTLSAFVLIAYSIGSKFGVRGRNESRIAV
ncbi:MAG: transporter permease [Marmoricola sp.]|nr:transporter permease [Marmoricola sp.]